MPPPAIIDVASLDLTRICADRDAIAAVNPQRYEFQMLDAVLFYDAGTGQFAGYYDVRPDAWWARGHLPGRPLMPGVLMIESAAQLMSFVAQKIIPGLSFIGFAGIDEAKFRAPVSPPSRLVILGQATQVKKRRIESRTQGFIGNEMVFEAVIAGMQI
jgi:3-hydroxyacyl-[acyl-carrier-protein] dehydratase